MKTLTMTWCRATYLKLPPKLFDCDSKISETPILSKKQQCLSLLHACTSMNHLFQIQAHACTSGLLSDKFLASELLRFSVLSSSGDLSHARNLLDRCPDPMRSSWNHLLRGYSQHNLPERALRVFVQMRRRGVTPNELTYPFVFKSCAETLALELGRQVHADIEKNGVGSVVYAQNTLMLLYGSCCKIDEVKKVFDDMPVKTIVSWNTILSAFLDNFSSESAIELFKGMRRGGFEPDQTTFVVLLSASAELGSLSSGRCFHALVVSKEMDINLQLGTALVNMYAKCGAIDCANKVFERMTVRNVWTWSAMILGFGQHGSPREALDLFTQMRDSSVEPNYVTFLGVFCACSHGGLVDEGRQFFREMVHVNKIEPTMAHYSAMVDVLGRKGLLLEAYEFIMAMPVEPDAVVWRTLLSACQIHSAIDVDGVGEEARRRLLSLEPRRSGNYVIAANMYSEAGSWREAAKLRRTMREEGLKKMVAESCIDLGGSLRKFISGDDSFIECKSIKQLLDGLNLNMRIIALEDVNCHIDL